MAVQLHYRARLKLSATKDAISKKYFNFVHETFCDNTPDLFALAAQQR